MKKTILSAIVCSVLILVVIAEACKTKDVLGPKATRITFVTPAGWPAPVYDFNANPLTAEGIALGRKLFYDGRLSKDGNFSCAGCHQSIAAFGTYDHDLSHGINNTHTLRNALPLQNLAWQKTFGWDGASQTIEAQILRHVTSPTEMGETLPAVIAKLQADDQYLQLFKAAYQTTIIDADRLTRALSQFVLTMISSNSKYDKVKRNETTFILPEQLGYNIFTAKCATCHSEPLFTDFTYRNTGLPIDPFLKDYGRMRVTNNPADSLKFKVPSLRNAGLSYPYAHDGRFYTSENMLEHYRNGVINGPTTDSTLRNKIILSNFEVGQLKAFLLTLTDTAFVNNPAFSKP